jgi:acylphosphatase
VRIAGRFAVNGFVQNLPDGGVLLVAEGEAAELDRFTAEVAKAMRPYIERVDQEVQPASGAYAGFSIRYH